jgi:hypothetical protein
MTIMNLSTIRIGQESDGLTCALRGDGTMASLRVRCAQEWESIGFRSDEWAGPRFDGGVALRQEDGGEPVFSGTHEEIHHRLAYAVEGGRLRLAVTVENRGARAYAPGRLSLILGLDTYMATFPEWNERYFPTLLRCEKTHFWGYAMTPRGRILGISSPDPVAAWHLEYKPWQHRIYTLSLDLLHRGPLPERHPQGLDRLRPGERRQWTIFLEAIPALAQVKPRLAATTGAPMIACDRHTVEPGTAVGVSVFGAATTRKQVFPGGTAGVCTFTEKTPGGKVAEAKIYVRRPWSWYLRRARAEALDKAQIGSSHVEGWMGFFSCFLARRHLPDAALDARAERKFQEIWPTMYDMERMRPTSWEDRIQNHACAASLMVDRYQAGGDLRDLEFAAALADLMLTKQSADGAYRNGEIHYTSVIYIGKSIMEVMEEERRLGAADPRWQARYERHRDSVRRAMDELVRSLDNIQTEGEMTYEDGMISCSCAQLAMFALLQDDPAERQKYLAAARYFANGHRCLSQLLVPDCRMNGGSLRFWEAQYDILASPNMMNSPHGWSAWRIYGLYYLYLLTGEPDWLRQTMDALGACVQLIDADSGTLRWGFVSDPFIAAKIFKEFPDAPGKGRCVETIVGEEYLPMISGWYKAPAHTLVTGYWGGDPQAGGLGPGESWPDTWVNSAFGGQPPFPPPDGRWPRGGDGGCCDNDVHEIFKCLEEVALPHAFIIEGEDGAIECWNCAAEHVGGSLRVVPSEAMVSRVHCNTRRRLTVTVEFDSGPVTNAVSGLVWIDAGNPEPGRPGQKLNP